MNEIPTEYLLQVIGRKEVAIGLLEAQIVNQQAALDALKDENEKLTAGRERIETVEAEPDLPDPGGITVTDA